MIIESRVIGFLLFFFFFHLLLLKTKKIYDKLGDWPLIGHCAFNNSNHVVSLDNLILSTVYLCNT
jgi:hypothetical protein